MTPQQELESDGSAKKIERAVRDNFAFLLDIEKLDDCLGYEIIPGHVVRQATNEEIDEIKRRVQWLSSGPQGDMSEFLWEERVPRPDGRVEILPPEEWRYFVIAFRGSNVPLHALIEACLLHDNSPEVGMEFVRLDPYQDKSPGLIWHPGRFFHSLDRLTGYNGNSRFRPFSRTDCEAIAKTYKLLIAHNHELIDLHDTVRAFEHLCELPHSSPLKFLGYFTILESLITHQPADKDPYDTIIRQVKKKMTLLDRRFDQGLNYGLFPGITPEAVWTKLYEYRSAIAHGTRPNFGKDLQALKDHDTALSFLRQAARAVARQALNEPQLISSLRAC